MTHILDDVPLTHTAIYTFQRGPETLSFFVVNGPGWDAFTRYSHSVCIFSNEEQRKATQIAANLLVAIEYQAHALTDPITDYSGLIKYRLDIVLPGQAAAPVF